jgi:hypothetical protein
MCFKRNINLKNQNYMSKINIPLFVFDFIILLPITLIRMILIYIYGSRYNIPELKFLDIMMHAENKHFNGDLDIIDTIKNESIAFNKPITEHSLTETTHNLAEITHNFAETPHSLTEMVHINSPIFEVANDIESPINKFNKKSSIRDTIQQMKEEFDSLEEDDMPKVETVEFEEINESTQTSNMNFLFTEDI